MLASIPASRSAGIGLVLSYEHVRSQIGTPSKVSVSGGRSRRLTSSATEEDSLNVRRSLASDKET